MKLRIENSEAREAQFGAPFRPPCRAAGRVWIDLTVDKQRESHWCWAAITAALAGYYHDLPLDQAAIAGGVNVDRALDEVLAQHGCFGHWSLGKPTFERVAFEIDSGRPLCARIQWYSGGAHYVVVKGYGAAARTLLVEDSLTGPAEQAWSQFPHGYAQRGGVWTETFWTEQSPRRTHE
jgi:hypothetical protein